LGVRVTEPKVYVIILAYNKKEALKQCLESIQRDSYIEKEIVVVDNASSDGSSEMLRSTFSSITVISNRENLGYTGGNNIGMKFALKNRDCDYLLILNDDTIVDPDLITLLVKFAKANPKIGVVNPKILDFETKREICNNYGKYNFYIGIGHKLLLETDDVEEISLFRGTCFLIKKEVIDKIGLMDENFFMYFDEADLSFRVKKAGFVMLHVSKAIVYHQLSHSFSGRMNPIVEYYSTRNELLFARKHLNLWAFYPFWFPRFIFRILRYFLIARDPHSIKFIVMGARDFSKNKFGRAYF
jgi:GT2 family glycosyltransferase